MAVLVDKLAEDWQVRLIRQTEGNRTFMGALLLGIFQLTPDQAAHAVPELCLPPLPAIGPTAAINEAGVVLINMVDKHDNPRWKVPIGTQPEVRQLFQRVADEGRLNQSEADALTGMLVKWIAVDNSPKPS